MRVVVYTALFGAESGDALRPVLHWTPSAPVQYVCFTDQALACPRWECRPAVHQEKTARRTARWHKLMAHAALPEAEVSIWLDACLQWRGDPYQLVAQHLAAAELATFRHPQRDCIYAEQRACVRFRKDDPALMQAQVDYYRYCGYPPAYGLAETALLARRHTPAVATFNELWWTLMQRYSCRDQLGFDFVAWYGRHEYGIIPGNRGGSAYTVFHARRPRPRQVPVLRRNPV